MTIPCVMVLEDDGMQLKQAVEAARQPVVLGLYDPTQRPTLLRSGYPQDGVVPPNGASHYQLSVAGAHTVTLSLSHSPLPSTLTLALTLTQTLTLAITRQPSC